jgi:hypothetical protein
LPCLTRAFFNCTPDKLRENITDGNELEDKTTLAFFVDGEPASDVEFLRDYNRRHPHAHIGYPGKLMERALEEAGILSFGTKLDHAHTKNLVSYCYDTEDGSLSKQGITLRIRHEEYRDPQTGNFKSKAPDISTKFQLEENSTASRAEFEAQEDFVHVGDGVHKFNLTLVGIMEQEVTKRLESHDAMTAMAWLQKFTEKVGYDFSDKREKSNINCRRTQPYAVMYTRKDHNGELIRDKDGKPKLFKTDEIPAEDQLKRITTANKIVFMFCLDVNRIFAPGNNEDKIARDHEWEHEYQDHKCAFTPGAIKSSDGVTREEIDAMDEYLKAMKAKVMRDNNIGKSPLSGLNKDARAHLYVQRRYGQLMPAELTVRGTTGNFMATRISSFEELLKHSPLIKGVYEEACRQHALKRSSETSAPKKKAG